MEETWAWLNTNNGAVTAIAALAGVVVAIIYTFFTLLLWCATKKQAEITKQIFEASNRPYLVLNFEEPTDTTVDGHISFAILFSTVVFWARRGDLISP